MVSRGVLLVALLFALGACGVQTANVGDCGDDRVADLDHVGPDGQPDPCHLQDPPDRGDGCAGDEYVHWPVTWEEPVWLWFGPEEQAPDCPNGPMSTAYEGHADLVAPLACEACTCEPPTGACALPSTIMASSKDCGDFSAGMPAPFDAPVPWDGSCDSTAQLPAGAAHALKIGALTMTEDGCAPGPTVPAKVISSSWKTYARACDGKGWSPGPIEHSVCIPAADRAPLGFRLCAVQKGEYACPMLTGDLFTERHVFFEGVDDKRACSECTCGPPTGSVCTATISIYKGGDLTCSGPPFALLPVSSVMPACHDIAPPGQALGSKSAGPTTYIPGSCPPMGGQPNGLAATGIQPTTFCCRP